MISIVHIIAILIYKRYELTNLVKVDNKDQVSNLLFMNSYFNIIIDTLIPLYQLQILLMLST